MKRTRPKTPAPQNGWLLAELARLTDLPETTLRYYVAQKLIRPIQRRGTATRYGRNDLMLLLGFVRLKSDEVTTLVEKKRKLEAMGAVELERWLREGPLPDEAARALDLQSKPPRSPVSAAAATGGLHHSSTIPPRDIHDVRFEKWQRIPLLAGLDLMLRTDANKAARVAAQRIYEQYVAAAGEDWQA
jgi:DNA-binding transcriptional MerR regulator